MDYKFITPEYFAPIPDIRMALERIGLNPDEDWSPSVENLSKIMLAHMMTVPYENLDIYDFHRHIDFAPAHLFEKFVINRRGGYCYEINGFFMTILEGLGYDCTPLSGRLLFGGIRMSPMSHRTTIVTINGVEYLCDVGYGAGCAEGPVRLDDPGVQDIQGKLFSIRNHFGDEFGDLTLVKHTEKGEEEFYTVYKRPHTVLEFIGPNFNTSQNPSSAFRTKRVVRLRTPEGSIVVDNKIFRTKRGDEVIEEEIPNYERLYEILTTRFGMIIPRLSFSPDWPRKWFLTAAEKQAAGDKLPELERKCAAVEADKRGKYTPGNPEYFAPLPDLDAALQRIGLSRAEVAEKSRENLGKIILACLRTIPFENLDCCDYRRRVDFALPHLHEKIVLNRRGGYCYELNSFLTGLLEGLGYECVPLGARLMMRGEPVIMAQSHRTTIVTAEGVRYLCDIGFGGDGNAEGPVSIDTAEVQEIRGKRFQVEHHPGGRWGDLTMYRFLDDGAKVPFCTLYTKPHTPLDFVGPNFNMSTNPTSRFTSNRMVRMVTETGSIAIDNNIYRKRINGEVSEETITTTKRLYEILTQDFKMIVPKMSFNSMLPREWF